MSLKLKSPISSELKLICHVALLVSKVYVLGFGGIYTKVKAFIIKLY